MVIIQAVLNALAAAFDMLWEVFWPLALGFILSAIVQTLVSRRAVERALGSDSPRSLALATIFGAASSSCSYAAVAIARSLFRKGASFPAAMVFEFASTNLVFELFDPPDPAGLVVRRRRVRGRPADDRHPGAALSLDTQAWD